MGKKWGEWGKFSQLFPTRSNYNVVRFKFWLKITMTFPYPSDGCVV